MTRSLGKNCSFDLPHMYFVNCSQFMCNFFRFRFEGGIGKLTLLVSDHSHSVYFQLTKGSKHKSL